MHSRSSKKTAQPDVTAAHGKVETTGGRRHAPPGGMPETPSRHFDAPLSTPHAMTGFAA